MMKNMLPPVSNSALSVLPRACPAINQFGLLFLLSVLTAIAGCGTGPKEKQKNDFFTSGSREADQRASQRMAKSEQLAGSGEGAGEKNVKKARPGEVGAPDTAKAAEAEGKLTLFDRLGGERGIEDLVDDFIKRVMQDPRVNWQRKAVKRNFLGQRKPSSVWNPSADNIATLKKHFVQFLVLATGGPPRYEGKEIKSVHAGMRITNPEFDAALGDLKASLDRFQIPNKEQKELLAVIESTRPQIVTER
jgi:hemoglobin